MASNLPLASKIIIEEEEPQQRAIDDTATAVIALLGTAERGPLWTPTRCESWEDFRSNFGSFTLTSDLALAAWAIYRQHKNAAIWVTRIVRSTDQADPVTTKTSAASTVDLSSVASAATAGVVTGTVAGTAIVGGEVAWALSPGDTLDIHCDEDAGGPDTVTFNATRATRAGAGLAIVDLNGDTLTLRIDGGAEQTITFTASETSALTVAAKINSVPLLGGFAVENGGEVDISSDTLGTGSSVEITGGTALGEIGHSTGTTSGTGNVVNTNQITGAELETIIEAGVTNPATGVAVTINASNMLVITSETTGASSSIQIEATSTAHTALGLDNTLHSGSASSSVSTLTVTAKTDGTWGDALRPNIEDATNGESTYFNLILKNSSGAILERWANIQNTDDTATDFVDTVLNHASTGSIYITATDLAQALRPANTAVAALTGGDDGLSGIADADYIGDASGRSGLYAFDIIDEVSLLGVPNRATSAVLNAMVSYCESDRNGQIFPILETPQSLTKEQMKTFFVTTAGLKNLSEFGAIYWPWIKIANPRKAIFGDTDELSVAPSSSVLGVISRVDNVRDGGIYDEPAGVEEGRIFGCLGFVDDEVLDESARDFLYPENINPIQKPKGWPRCIDGNKTLKSTGNWPMIAQRRGVSYMEGRCKEGTEWVRHKGIDSSLLKALYRTLDAFIDKQRAKGAFSSKIPDEAYSVDVSEKLNPPSLQNQFKVRAKIGLAMINPAEFVYLGFSKNTLRKTEVDNA